MQKVKKPQGLYLNVENGLWYENIAVKWTCRCFIVSVQRGLPNESGAAQGFNQRVSILFDTAAAANNTIRHINNRPNSWAGQRTDKGKRQKAKPWIRRQFWMKWVPSQLRFIAQWQTHSGHMTSRKDNYGNTRAIFTGPFYCIIFAKIANKINI